MEYLHPELWERDVPMEIPDLGVGTVDDNNDNDD